VVAPYQKHISGPLINRIDIHVDVPRLNYEKLSGTRQGEPSHAMRERVEDARTLQAKRFEAPGY
jgi:magnesium chelatase family protein